MKPTREQILAEPAGRKLDTLVSELVFGNKVSHLSHSYHAGNDLWIGVPAYSTDIAAAWQVVEKMGESDPDTIRDKFGGYFIYNQLEIWNIGPIDICRAALLAVLGDEP